MNELKVPIRPTALYNADFYRWTEEQGQRLRAVRSNSIDWENVAEEIESLGRSQRSAIRSHLVVALTDLLKWAHQPEGRNNSWKASIYGARAEILGEIDESPSLKGYPAPSLQKQYALARLRAAGATKLDLDVFPEACPFTIEQVLDPEFYPELARG